LSNADPCIDGTFHNAKDGAVEQDFVAEQAANDTGFSERSFFLALYQQTPAPLILVPVPWGDQASAPKLVYSDAFVTSHVACGKDPCETDAAGFAAFMTIAATKKYIAMAGDLPGGSPARHLIVATKPFYDDDDVKADPVYAQVMSGFPRNQTDSCESIKSRRVVASPDYRYANDESDILARIRQSNSCHC